VNEGVPDHPEEGAPDSTGMAAPAVEEEEEEEEGGPPSLPMCPPLYTEHSSDVPHCPWAWEPPPPYTGPAHPPLEHTQTHTHLTHTHTQPDT